MYMRLKHLERELEFINIQEEYIKEEQKSLKRELLRAAEEVKRIRSVPLTIGQFLEMIDDNMGIVSSTTGSNYYARILSTIDRELLKPSASVALHRFVARFTSSLCLSLVICVLQMCKYMFIHISWNCVCVCVRVT